MAPLYLVRHTAVELDEHAPPHEWLPSPEGLEAARRLAALPLWRRVELVATSTEPKARATAEPIARAAGVPLREEPDLREVEREAAPLDAAWHRDRVRRYLAGEPVAGWEPRDAAVRRFERCLDLLVADAAGPLAVVSHGTVMSLYLGFSFAEWSAIEVPAVSVVDAATRCVLQPFAGVDVFARS